MNTKPMTYIFQVLISLSFIIGILGWTAYVGHACMVDQAEVYKTIKAIQSVNK